MKKRTLGSAGLQVSAIGLGCMGMSFAYGASDERQAINTLHRAFDLGVDFLDTAEVYGPFTNESLLGRVLKGHQGKVKVATKFGFHITDEGEGWERIKGVNSRPENIRAVVEASLQRLGIEAIDLLYQHRPDPAVPVEEVVGTMADLVREGKVLHLGLSEISSETLQRAQAVHPIAAVQSEYSLWSRDPEQGLLETCRRLGVGFVPYSPLGRGFLTGKVAAAGTLAEDDFRRYLPRFQQQAWEHNQQLVVQLTEMAQGYRASPAQLALAWVLAQGENVVPIPGARQQAHLEDNCAAADVVINDRDLATLNTLFAPANIAGERYSEQEFALVER
ncbi:aldo/keto reductase [Erwinia sp. JUb26]|uniref:aldo/keto reductase n=1 Tax=Erwinia sp. JUb26 TaxID=2485126 RepID=UPI000F463E3F|nr:aldo/keto reductase [Erwinia sp. JUb26]ROR05117.1 aryl-alcohol dehydrogenase-like predicted oxidoreductase [Erwinia sp. JUb26]